MSNPIYNAKGEDYLFASDLDPTVTPVNAKRGTIFINTGTVPAIFQKSDSGLSTNWTLVGGVGTAVWGGITGTLSNQIDLQNALNVKQDTIAAANNQLFYQDAPNSIVGIPGVFYNPVGKGLAVTSIYEPDNLNFQAINGFSVNVNPIANSPNDIAALINLNFNIDTDNNGFEYGTVGDAFRFFNNFVNHQGLSDVGGINFLNNSFNMGNGVDPINVRGVSYSYGFGNFNANVTIDGPLQGYGFQVNVDPAANIDLTNCYASVFYDFAQMSGSTMGFYTTFQSSPQIGAIADNYNFSGLNINPVIGEFLGNANFTGIGVYGTLNDFDTGVYKGIEVQPNITAGANHTGIRVDMTNVTGSTNVRAMEITGDVQINGSLSFTGALSIGQLTAFNALNLVDGGGTPTTSNGLISGITGLAGVTTANCDTIGVNTAALITLQANSINTSGPFKLGVAPLALPAVVITHTGSSLDFLNLSLYALNLDGSSTGGVIDRVNGSRVEAIPNGITTINEFVAFEFDQSFGQVGTTVWGIHIVPTFAENFIGGSLKIGGSDTVANSSVALEIESTTKAFLNARMTTAQRDALTAINGMQIYNTSTDKLQVYAAGVWVDLH
jgi:hypothetical protein